MSKLENDLVETIKIVRSACKKCNVKFVNIDNMLTSILELSGKIVIANTQAGIDKEPLGCGNQEMSCTPDDCLLCEFLGKIDKTYPHNFGIELKCRKMPEQKLIGYVEETKLIKMHNDNVKFTPPEWCPIIKGNKNEQT